jgi:hypothetical protein
LFIIVANMLSKVWFLRGKGTERHWGSGQRQVLYAHLNQRRVVVEVPHGLFRARTDGS